MGQRIVIFWEWWIFPIDGKAVCCAGLAVLECVMKCINGFWSHESKMMISLAMCSRNADNNTQRYLSGRLVAIVPAWLMLSDIEIMGLLAGISELSSVMSRRESAVLPRARSFNTTTKISGSCKQEQNNQVALETSLHDLWTCRIW